MLKYLLTLLAMGSLLAAQATVAAESGTYGEKLPDNYTISEGPLKGLTFEEAMTMKPREIRAKTGRKLRLMERVALKIAQKRFKKARKKKKKRNRRQDSRRPGDSIFGILSLSIFGFGLLSLLFIPFGFLVAGITALILGAIGMGRDARKGFAIAGFILGLLSMLFFLFLVVILLIAGL